MSDLTLKDVSEDDRDSGDDPTDDGGGGSLTDRLRELAQQLLDALDELLAPPPQLIPVRARPRRR